MKEAERSLAAAVAGELSAAGVRRAFGLPGGENLTLIAALRDAGVEFVLCNHETAAGFAASAHGLLAGAPGLVLATLGPGASNLLLPVANAQLDREALVAVCADLPASLPASHTHQRLPLLDVFRPVTITSAALRPADGRATARRAIAASLAGPRGAVVLTLSAEDAGRPAGDAGEPATGEEARRTGQLDCAEALHRLTERLRNAARPLVVVGHEVEPVQHLALRRWLERWELPATVTPKGKGLVDDRSPRFLGVVDGAGLLEPMQRAIDRADLVLAVGLDPVELIRPWHATAPVLWLRGPGSAVRDGGGEVLLADFAEVLSLLEEQDPPRRWDDAFADVRAERLDAFANPALPT